MDPQLRRLTRRVWQLEQELAELRERLSLGPSKAPQEPEKTGREASPPPEPSSSHAPSPAPAPAAGPSLQPGTLEQSLVGTWFPRAGALAILLGAGFAFKYAVDRGLIGPGARVALGVAAGLAFLAWGRWAFGRGWNRFGQAVTGGGLALIYLSILAAYLLYALVPAAPALALLTIAALGGAGLALYYDSVALAGLATFGGFLNPLLVSGPEASPAGLYLYVLALDTAVIALAYFRRWRLLDLLALAGTWIIFAATATRADFPVAFGFATAFFLWFAAIAHLRTGFQRVDARADDLALVMSNSLIHFAAGLALLGRDLDEWQGPFVLALAVSHLVGAAASIRIDRLLPTALMGLAIFFFFAWAPVQFDGFAITTGWALKGLLLVWIGKRLSTSSFTRAGILVTGAALVSSIVMLASRFAPERLLFTGDALGVVVQVAALYASAFLLRDYEGRGAAVALGVAASLLTLWWLSFEAAVYFRPARAGGDRDAFQFTLSALWGLYAAASLLAGIAVRAVWPRMMAVTLFGITILKMVMVDLWLLDTGYRVLAFVGLGSVLLLTSLLWHRFKELIRGPGGQAGAL